MVSRNKSPTSTKRLPLSVCNSADPVRAPAAGWLRLNPCSSPRISNKSPSGRAKPLVSNSSRVFSVTAFPRQGVNRWQCRRSIPIPGEPASAEEPIPGDGNGARVSSLLETRPQRKHPCGILTKPRLSPVSDFPFPTCSLPFESLQPQKLHVLQLPW